MEESTSRYWCHLCEQMVNPIVEQHQVQIKCPFCQSGFIEEMASSDPIPAAESETALSLWAPILLGMMGRPRRRRRFRQVDEEDSDAEEDGNGDLHRRILERDRELDSVIRRRRTSSAAILQLLQGIRAGLASETENLESLTERERERVILINPFDQTLLVQGQTENPNQNQNPIGSLGDYFVGPGLDLLLQHLTENDPNRYGTPPARKEAVEALPSVAIMGNLQCPVCLDDFEAGTEAREMPCNHKFHSACILPWLELHSSCPVCRFQLPSDESKHDLDGNVQRETGGENDNLSVIGGEEGRNGNGGRRFTLPWPFSGLFSSSASQSNNGNSSSSSNANNGNEG